MAPDREPGTLLPAEHDLVFVYQLADELKSDRRLVQLNSSRLCHAIDRHRRRYASCHTAWIRPRLAKVICQKCDQLIRSYELPASVDHAEPVRVAIRREP